jgi:hypothetical protein
MTRKDFTQTAFDVFKQATGEQPKQPRAQAGNGIGEECAQAAPANQEGSGEIGLSCPSAARALEIIGVTPGPALVNFKSISGW